MEKIREVKINVDDEEFANINDAIQFLNDLSEADITIYIDTNKATYEKEFTDADEAILYLETLL